MERAKRQTQPRQFLRFTNPAVYGSATEFPFSVDFASGEVVASTKPKRTWITAIAGNTQTVEAELGRSDVGSFKAGLLDKGGEMLKYFSSVPLTLDGAHNNSTTTILVDQDTTGYPMIGTVEILSAGVRERVRYTGKDLRSFTGCTRGVDGTSAASHSDNDGVSNGEQIRRGSRVQLFCGYAALSESNYMSFTKMEVMGRSMGKDRITLNLSMADVQRSPSRQTIFLTASVTNQTRLSGNPIDIMLAVLLSTGDRPGTSGTIAKTVTSTAIVGTGTSFTSYSAGDILRCSDGEIIRIASVADNTHLTAAQAATRTATGLAFAADGINGNYDVLDANDGLGIPAALVDIAAFEALRTSDFSTEQYIFFLIAPENGKAFIEEQFMKTLNCYPKVDQNGKLSIVRYRVALVTPTVTLDQDVITAFDWLPADAQIINDVQFRYDYGAAGADGIFGTFQEYMHGTRTDFTMSIGKYGRTTPLVIEAKGWHNGWGAQAMATARAEQVTDRYAEPQTILSLDCFYSKHTLEVGDQVYVNDARIPNIRTGGRGIVNEVFEVLDITPSFRPYKVSMTLLWVAAIPASAAPTSQGVVSTPNPQVSDANLNRALGIEAGSFAYWHKGVFTGSSPRSSWREAALEFAYTQVSADVLKYEIYFDVTDAAWTVGGLDLAWIDHQATAQAVAAGTITLVASASGVDDYYNGMYADIVTANGLSFLGIRRIVDYVGSTKVATLESNWGTTPSGTVVYRIVERMAALAGGLTLLDQDGVNASPSTAIGSPALGRWYLRSIPLPAGLDGKTIISMATGMDSPPASSTQIMLIKNPRIVNATGVIVPLARSGFTSMPVWAYGADANATVTARQEISTAPTSTDGLMLFGVSRGDSIYNVTGNNISGAEAVIGTIEVFVARASDRVRIHASMTLTISVAPSGGSGKGATDRGHRISIFRIRRDSISGSIIDHKACGLEGWSPAIGITHWQVPGFTCVDVPGITGAFQTYVLTVVEDKNNEGGGGSTNFWDELQFSGFVVSA